MLALNARGRIRHKVPKAPICKYRQFYSSKYHGSAIGNFWSRYVAKDGGLAVVITDSPKYRTGKICKTYSCPHRMTAAGCFVNK